MDAANDFSVTFYDLKAKKSFDAMAGDLTAARTKNDRYLWMAISPYAGNRCYKFGNRADIERFCAENGLTVVDKSEVGTTF